MNSQRGFTLLELVVVIAIFGVMSVMAYGGLRSVLTSRAHVEESLMRITALQKAWLRLRNDFQQVQPRPARDGFGAAQPALVATDQGPVEFTRGGWRNPLGHERSGMQRVAYRLDGKKLLRETWLTLDRAQDAQPEKTELLDDVTELRWRFLDGQRQWQTRWPLDPPQSPGLAAKAPLPLAVEITLVTKDSGELTFLFRTGIETRAAAAPPLT